MEREHGWAIELSKNNFWGEMRGRGRCLLIKVIDDHVTAGNSCQRWLSEGRWLEFEGGDADGGVEARFTPRRGFEMPGHCKAVPKKDLVHLSHRERRKIIEKATQIISTMLDEFF